MVRVDLCGASLWITVQHLRSGAMSDFASWEAFVRHVDPRRSGSEREGDPGTPNPFGGDDG